MTTRVLRARVAMVLAGLICAAGVAGCADAFHDLAEGDCTSGEPRIDGALSTIDCAEYDRSNADHHRVIKVFDEDAQANCPLGSQGVEDGGRVVCFGK